MAAYTRIFGSNICQKGLLNEHVIGEDSSSLLEQPGLRYSQSLRASGLIRKHLSYPVTTTHSAPYPVDASRLLQQDASDGR